MRALFFLVASLSAQAQGAPWIVITEVHYHPPGGAGEEFLEILNREPPRVDLGGWIIEGDIDYRFPDGTVVLPREHVVIARDPAGFRERHPELKRVLGPYARQLGNGGGRVTLRNAAGGKAAEVRFGTRNRWPVAPDGTGHTLSLADPWLDPEDPRNWRASELTGGTPGAANFAPVEIPATPIVRRNAVWRFTAGEATSGGGWREPGFDDSSWRSGPGGLGYGDGDDETVIEDMQRKHISLVARHAFQVADPSAFARLILRVDYDDGFVAYLNAKEIARASMGPEGSDAPLDRPSEGKHEAGAPAELDLGPGPARLLKGKNVLAVQVHNDDLASSDLSLIVELEARDPQKVIPRGAIWLNEVHAAGPDSFIEVYNAGDGDVDLAGYFLTDDPRNLRKRKLDGPALIRPRQFAAFRQGVLGEGFALDGPAIFVALTDPRGTRVIDALRLGGGGGKDGKKDGNGKAGPKPAENQTAQDRPKLAAPSPPRGRFPDGGTEISVLDAPTPGAPNRSRREADVVINEVLYHSLADSDEDEFVELHNKGSRDAALAGFRLTGAVRYSFPAEAKLAPGAFLVVAKVPAALAKKHGLAAGAVVGPYEGSLSATGEEIVLRDDRGNIADRVPYADKAPWPRWADGLGSSLELIDPELDNSLPAAWAASDGSSQSKWETFTYTKEHRAFQGNNLSELQFLLLDAGECLIDDIKVSGVLEESFERGAGGWNALGTHERSGIHKPGEARSGAQRATRGEACYRIVADGRGNARTNHISRDVPGGLVPGKKYKVSFRARWLRGSPLLLTRSPGQGVAKLHRLSLPEKVGTPGAENSTRMKDGARPAVGVPVQDPIAPASGQPATFAVRISARGGVRQAAVRYRRDGEAAWSEAPLADDGQLPDLAAGDGVWSGQAPGMPQGLVAFIISAEDAEGRVGTFPADPGHPALYAVGISPSRKFPTYTLLVANEEWQAYSRGPRLSNRLLDATLVYGDSRIFYNVGLRPRGSPFTRSNKNWRVVFGAETVDGRSTLTLDGQGGDGTKLNERLTYWFAEQLRAPNSRQQYVYFRLFGRDEGIFEDVEKVDGGYLERWFGPREPGESQPPAGPAKGKKPEAKPDRRPAPKRGGLLHKIDDYWELVASGYQAYREADFVFTSTDPEDYRWNFPPRAGGMREEFEPLVKLVGLLDPRTTPDRGFEERVEKAVDVDEWLKVLAARTLVDDWDTMGRDRGKNAFLYLPHADGRWKLLVWDCDLAWRDPNTPLFSPKFPGVRRLLERPAYRRRYLGYLAYLAERAMNPQHFGAVLQELKGYSGAATQHFEQFAAARRAFVLRHVPRRPFQIAEARRVERSKEPDVARVTGSAGPIVMRFRLEGREGAARFGADDRWVAEFPLGPEGGDLALEALDLGGKVMASATVKVRARSGAMPLPTAAAVELASASRKPRKDREAGPHPEDAPAGADGSAAVAGTTQPPPEPTEPRAKPAVPENEPAPAEPVERPVSPPVAEEADAAAREALAEVAREAMAKEDATSGWRRRETGPDESTRTPTGEAAAGGVEEGGDSEAEVVRRPEAWRIDLPPEPAAGSAGTWMVLAGVIAGLLALQAAILVAIRFRRRGPSAPRRAPDPPRSEGPGARELVGALASPSFERAAAGLERLSALGAEAVPFLLEALGDERPTPFQKIRGGPRGFTALPCQGPSSIRVRHMAALLLERLIGKPPVAKPARRDWEAWWKRARE